jgi:predicted hotdog family 3-hydroxylacyl-ACP dehydratase
MPLDRSWIERHIPHRGTMCLLDRVTAWDTERITCTASSHRAGTNPLRAHDSLNSVCGIEYAAQAMAIHGALLADLHHDRAPKAGYLTSVREVELLVPRLDDIQTDLEITAERIAGDDNNVLYRFSVRDAARVLLTGRAGVQLDAAAAQP